MFFIDLDEISSLKKWPVLSTSFLGLFSFHPRDYLTALTSQENVKDSKDENRLLTSVLVKYLKEKKIHFKKPRFFLLTHLRFLGYVFNPVSFYYCYDGDKPVCALAEVHNTFNERKIYFLEPNIEKGGFIATLDKDFYVSPFSHPHTQFVFRLSPPDNNIKTVVDQGDSKGIYFHSHFTGHRRSLTKFRLLIYTLLYLPITFKVTFLIHWEAFVMWIKRIPHYSKKSHSQYQKDFYRDS